MQTCLLHASNLIGCGDSINQSRDCGSAHAEVRCVRKGLLGFTCGLIKGCMGL